MALTDILGAPVRAVASGERWLMGKVDSGLSKLTEVVPQLKVVTTPVRNWYRMPRTKRAILVGRTFYRVAVPLHLLHFFLYPEVAQTDALTHPKQTPEENELAGWRTRYAWESAAFVGGLTAVVVNGALYILKPGYTGKRFEQGIQAINGAAFTALLAKDIVDAGSRAAGVNPLADAPLISQWVLIVVLAPTSAVLSASRAGKVYDAENGSEGTDTTSQSLDVAEIINEGVVGAKQLAVAGWFAQLYQTNNPHYSPVPPVVMSAIAAYFSAVRAKQYPQLEPSARTVAMCAMPIRETVFFANSIFYSNFATKQWPETDFNKISKFHPEVPTAGVDATLFAGSCFAVLATLSKYDREAQARLPLEEGVQMTDVHLAATPAGDANGTDAHGSPLDRNGGEHGDVDVHVVGNGVAGASSLSPTTDT